MRSRLNVSKPTSRARATERRTLFGSWVRPSASSTCGTIDCTPSETRVTPAARYAANNSLEFGATGTQIPLHEMTAIGPRRECAVVAAARAERDVDVVAEGAVPGD